MRCTVPRQTSVQEGTMKLLFFDDFKLGVLKGDAVIDVSETVRNIPHTGPHDLISGLIARFADYKERVQEAVDRGRGVPIGQGRIRPPLPKPSNIVCMAENYMEDGTRPGPRPATRCSSLRTASSAPTTPWCSRHSRHYLRG